MSDYQLHHGDCLDILPALDPGSVDAVICDPPYGTTACKWDSVIPFAPMWEQIRRVLKPRGACVLFGSQPFTSALVISNIKQYRHSWVWDKKRVTGGATAHLAPMRAHEDIVIFSHAAARYNPQMGSWDGIALTRRGPAIVKKDGAFAHADNISPGKDAKILRGRYPDTVLRIHALGSNDPERTGHPTQKPLALLEYLVKTYTNAGDTVLDFCYGSGTTGAACGNLGRRFVGIEKDRAYFDQGAARIADSYAPLRAMQQAG